MKAVKASYNATVNVLNNIYEQTHERQALGVSRALCKPSAVVAIDVLNYSLLQADKLSRALDADRTVLTAINPLVDATLNTPVVRLPVANWVLELMMQRVRQRKPLTSK